MGLLEIKWGLIFWTVVTFLALLAVLRAVAWKPILSMLEEREKTIRDSLEQARQAREDAERIMTQHRDMLTKARQEMAAIIEKAQRDAEQRRSDILARAHREAEEKSRRLAEELERQRQAALQDVRRETVDLVLNAASRLIETELNDEKHRALVGRTLADLKDLPAGR